VNKQRLPQLAASFLSLLVPCVLVERATNYAFLTGNPLYGQLSGLRIDLFVITILASSLVSGAVFRRLLPAAAASVAAIAAFLLLVNVACDPRVCYSAGPDGLEPLRMWFDFSSIAVAAAYAGVYLRKRVPPTPREYFAAGFATFEAIAYYPVIFTFAGTRVFAPLDPWAVGALLFALSFSTAAMGTHRIGRRWGVALPLLAGVSLLALSGGIAAAYFQSILQQMAVMVTALLAGSLTGAAAGIRSWGWATKNFAESSWPLLILILAVLLMTYVVIPDAAVGIIPVERASGVTEYSTGVPSWAGAYMDAALGSSEGVSLSVNFAGTNASAIQADNYLAAGIGAHSPGCCVDGIDYGYRFDAYLFHTGRIALAASAWEVCDDNAACGGHSWKVLMFQNESSLTSANSSTPIRIAMRWIGHTVLWSYSIEGGPSQNLTSFSPQAAEKAYFNTGILPGGWSQSGYYFFQFGISSGYPIGHPGWSVSISCPATLEAGGWKCIDHARTLQGGQSYWKVLWRYGDDYPNVRAATSPGINDTFSLSYSSQETMENFARLW